VFPVFPQPGDETCCGEWGGGGAPDMRRLTVRWGGLDWSGSRQGQVESSCVRGNEPSGPIKVWATVEWLYNW
jgi:hypothetical protein